MGLQVDFSVDLHNIFFKAFEAVLKNRDSVCSRCMKKKIKFFFKKRPHVFSVTSIVNDLDSYYEMFSLLKNVIHNTFYYRPTRLLFARESFYNNFLLPILRNYDYKATVNQINYFKENIFEDAFIIAVYNFFKSEYGRKCVKYYVDNYYKYLDKRIIILRGGQETHNELNLKKLFSGKKTTLSFYDYADSTKTKKIEADVDFTYLRKSNNPNMQDVMSQTVFQFLIYEFGIYFKDIIKRQHYTDYSVNSLRTDMTIFFVKHGHIVNSLYTKSEQSYKSSIEELKKYIDPKTKRGMIHDIFENNKTDSTDKEMLPELVVAYARSVQNMFNISGISYPDYMIKKMEETREKSEKLISLVPDMYTQLLEYDKNTELNGSYKTDVLNLVSALLDLDSMFDTDMSEEEFTKMTEPVSKFIDFVTVIREINKFVGDYSKFIQEKTEMMLGYDTYEQFGGWIRHHLTGMYRRGLYEKQTMFDITDPKSFKFTFNMLYKHL